MPHGTNLTESVLRFKFLESHNVRFSARRRLAENLIIKWFHFFRIVFQNAGSIMNKALAISLLFFFPAAALGQEGYQDLIDAMTRLISIQEKFVTTMKKTAKSEEVAQAMKDLGRDLRELHGIFQELEKKYPDFPSDEKKLPGEARVLLASSERASRRVTEVMVINLYRHGAEPAVAAEIAGIKDLLKSFITGGPTTPAPAVP